MQHAQMPLIGNPSFGFSVPRSSSLSVKADVEGNQKGGACSSILSIIQASLSQSLSMGG